VSIAQKRSAVCPAGPTSSAADGTPTDPEDIILQIRGSSAPSCDGPSGWRQPEDANPPAPLYFDLGTACNRWWTWQASGAHGTDSILPGRIYPLDGNRFVPGSDPAHLGGDTWSADAAITVIRNDPGWRGMLVSLGGIDKLGHMWGPEDMETGPPGSDQEMRHLPFVAKNADVQVGRIVDALQARGLLDETLIVRPRRPDRTLLPRPLRRLPAPRRHRLRPGHRLDRPALRLQTGTTAATRTRSISIRAPQSPPSGTP
jgi:hypothetical protein